MGQNKLSTGRQNKPDASSAMLPGLKAMKHVTWSQGKEQRQDPAGVLEMQKRGRQTPVCFQITGGLPIGLSSARSN
jgi:hypothetical protein